METRAEVEKLKVDLVKIITAKKGICAGVS